VRNCTFYRGGISINRWYSALPVTLRDCAMSQSAFPVADGYSGNTNVSDYSYNAFLEGAQRTTPTNATDLVVAGSAGWQTGWLGRFYLPTNSPLADAGSLTNAAVLGLYHHTSFTNQVKEANTRLNIGAHPIATDAAGIPLDTDSDGVPDYWEDRNGDGSLTTGETDWQTYNSPNGLQSGAGLQVFTPLK
jgi:hypothetical protein